LVAGEAADEAHVAVVLKAEGRLIGHMPFQPWFAPRIWEIGWVFDPPLPWPGLRHGGGHATAPPRVRELGLHRIVATCQPENVAPGA
jgi:RimJ/RimL family protein N-acetyltransferase